MQWKMFFSIFLSIFLAELGDKTQLATILFSSEKEVSKWLVFFGASLALITTTALGVFAGKLTGNYINPAYLHKIAGAAFVIIGVWIFIKS